MPGGRALLGVAQQLLKKQADCPQRARRSAWRNPRSRRNTLLRVPSPPPYGGGRDRWSSGGCPRWSSARRDPGDRLRCARSRRGGPGQAATVSVSVARCSSVTCSAQWTSSSHPAAVADPRLRPLDQAPDRLPFATVAGGVVDGIVKGSERCRRGQVEEIVQVNLLLRGHQTLAQSAFGGGLLRRPGRCSGRQAKQAAHQRAAIASWPSAGAEVEHQSRVAGEARAFGQRLKLFDHAGSCQMSAVAAHHQRLARAGFPARTEASRGTARALRAGRRAAERSAAALADAGQAIKPLPAPSCP